MWAVPAGGVAGALIGCQLDGGWYSEILVLLPTGISIIYAMKNI